MALMNSSTGRPAVQASSGLMNSTTGRPAVPAFNQGSDPEMSFSGQIQQGADVFGTLNSIREANNAFNDEQADKQMAYQTQSQEKALNFNAKEAQKIVIGRSICRIPLISERCKTCLLLV